MSQQYAEPIQKQEQMRESTLKSHSPKTNRDGRCSNRVQVIVNKYMNHWKHLVIPLSQSRKVSRRFLSDVGNVCDWNFTLYKHLRCFYALVVLLFILIEWFLTFSSSYRFAKNNNNLKSWGQVERPFLSRE